MEASVDIDKVLRDRATAEKERDDYAMDLAIARDLLDQAQATERKLRKRIEDLEDAASSVCMQANRLGSTVDADDLASLLSAPDTASETDGGE